MDQHPSFLHSSICTELFLVIVNISMLKKDTGDNLNIEERIIYFPNVWYISIFIKGVQKLLFAQNLLISGPFHLNIINSNPKDFFFIKALGKQSLLG